MKRRTFVKGTMAAAGLLQIRCGNPVSPAPWLELTAQADGRVLVSRNLNEFRNRVAGGAITVRLAQPRAADLPEAILVVRLPAFDSLDSRAFIAMTSACPHLGCPLGWSTQDQLIECPCHPSRFRAPQAVGECVTVDHGPATAPPQVFPVEPHPDPVENLNNFFVNLRPASASGGQIVVKIADHPQLAQPGGSATIATSGCGAPVIVVRKSATEVSALTAVCTHLACTVQYRASNNDLECPCHGSTFNLDGKVTLEPAMRDLKAFTATIRGDEIVITLS
jgi:Rieske Fe-S protein